MTFPARGENVKLGKGALMLDLQDANGDPTGLHFVGNATSMTLSANVTTAELYSSTEASAGLLARNRTRVAYTLAAVLSEFELTNLRLFLLGEEASQSQASGSAATATLLGVNLGRYYELGARRVTNVAVLRGTDPAVLNVDYELNAEYGVIHIREDSTLFLDNDDVHVTFDKPALSIKQVRIGKAASQLARLVYMADDANSAGAGSKDRLEVWKVDIAPDGDLNLISDDYGTFNLTMPVLTDATNHPDDPYGKLERAVAA